MTDISLIFFLSLDQAPDRYRPCSSLLITDHSPCLLLKYTALSLKSLDCTTHNSLFYSNLFIFVSLVFISQKILASGSPSHFPTILIPSDFNIHTGDPHNTLTSLSILWVLLLPKYYPPSYLSHSYASITSNCKPSKLSIPNILLSDYHLPSFQLISSSSWAPNIFQANIMDNPFILPTLFLIPPH